MQVKNKTSSSYLSAIAAGLSARKVAAIAIAILSMILILYCLRTNPIREGDGYEYALILESFFNHFSPDIREADITSLIKIVESQPSTYDVNVLQRILEAYRNGEDEIYLGVLKSNQGEYFGYHFWLYPLINLPVKAFLAALNLNELKAFQLTNALLIILTIVYVLLFSKQSPFGRWAMSLLYLAGCIFFYLKWPHPEIFIAAMILISGCAFMEKRLHLSVIAATLATLQNPSVVFLVASIFIFSIFKDFNINTLRQPIMLIKKHIGMAIIASFSLLPYIFYYYHYQKFSLIAYRGFVDPSLISMQRFMSTIFDLNQGLIVGFPGIMIGVFLLIVYRLIQAISKNKKPYFNQIDILLVAFLLMLQPTLSQTNWNHGQSIFSRYAFWLGMILIVWVVANLDKLPRLTKYSLLTLILGLQFLPNELFFRRPRDGHYLKMKPQAAWVISNFPGWYNPDPEIFAERVRESERFGETIAPNIIDSPFIHLDKLGNIRKILIHQDLAAQTQARICGNDGKIVNLDSEIPLETLLQNVNFNRQGWGYMNGKFQCVLPFSINFAEGGNSRNFTRQGWSRPAADGSLIRSNVARFIVPIHRHKLVDMQLSVKIDNLSENQDSLTNLEVLVNDTPVSQWNLKLVDQTIEYQAMIPANVLSAQSPIFVSFRFGDGTNKLNDSTKVKVRSLRMEAKDFK